MRLGISKRLELIRNQWPLLTFSLAMAFIYSLYSLLKHWHFKSSACDLGIFDQAIWHYSRFEVPASTVIGVDNLLGDHFHPILIILAPLYWLFPGVSVLLVAQGILFALAIIPIYLFTRKRLGSLPAYLFSLSYAIFWGVQSAIDFDFHAISFAVPLIAFAIYFMDNRKWFGYFICIALLLLVKEDMCILVAFFGLCLLIQKQTKPGIISFLAGTVSFFFITMVLIPFFAGPQGNFIYWSDFYHDLGSDNASVIKTLLTRPFHVLKLLFVPGQKVLTVFTTFGSFALLGLFSPLVLLTIPLFLERFLSSKSLFWGLNYHYTAALSPIIVMASADGIYRLARLIETEKVRNNAVIAVSILVLVINISFFPTRPLHNLLKPSFYSLSTSKVTGYEALELIPPGASVVSQNNIVPHLSHRQEVYVLKDSPPEADYIIASSNLSPWPNESYDVIEQYLSGKKEDGYNIIFDKDGWVVYKSPGVT